MWERFMGSRSSLVIAATFLGVVLLCGVLALVRSLDDSDEPTAQVPVTPATSAAATGTCPTDTGQSTPTTRLPGLRWERIGPVMLPYSSTAGPCTVTATTASGYAHTPAGALLAGAQIASRTSITTPLEIATETIQQQVVAGPARDALLSSTKAKADEPLKEEDAGQLAAWSMLSYTADTAVVSLALSNASLPGQYVTLPITVRWADGDWRLVAPPGGSWDSSAAVTPVLDGYVEWGRS